MRACEDGGCVNNTMVAIAAWRDSRDTYRLLSGVEMAACDLRGGCLYWNSSRLGCCTEVQVERRILDSTARGRRKEWNFGIVSVEVLKADLRCSKDFDKI